MEDKLIGALEALKEKLLEQEATVVETKKMINALMKMVGEDPLFSDIESAQSQSVFSVRPDQYYGKGLITAAREQLERVKRACSADEILNAITRGGFDFSTLKWKEKDRLRSLSISLAKNSRIFHRLPNGYFGMLKWYPEVEKAGKKQAKKNDQEKKERNEEEENGKD